jgi:Tol biopolymer transport system component
MGEVYRARDTKLGREVALKILPDLFAQDPERLARFEREARTLAALNHPNIATLFGIGEEALPNPESRIPNPVVSFLIMELVEGDDLSTLIARRSAGAAGIALADALPIARQIAEALEAAHEQGVVHRDLKPANVKVRADGVVKVLDFGLAKALAPDGASTTADAMNSPTLTARARLRQGYGEAGTEMGVILGTAAYMAPEQARGKVVDKRADVWAFGAVLYEMLTGERAFRGEDISDTLAAVLRQDITLSALPATAPPRLVRLIGRCLERDPKQRLRDIGDARIEIAEAERDLAQGPSTTPASVAPVPARPRPWPWIVAAVATTVALVIAGAWAVSYFRRSPPVEEPAIHLSLNPPEGGQFTFGNSLGGIALSPDGRAAAFVAARNGTNLLWVTDLDGSTAKPLSGTEGAAYPFWSPDNKSVAFFSGGKLRRVEKNGGAPLTICEVAWPRGGAWMSDHRILFGSMTAGLFVVPDSAGRPSPLTTLDTSRGETSHRWPQVLPGGRFLYFVQSGRAETQGIYAASFATPTKAAKLVSASANGLYAPGGDGRSHLLRLLGATLVAQEFDLATPALTGESHPIAEPVTGVGITNQMNVAVPAVGLLLYAAVSTPEQFTWIDRAAPGKKPLDVIGEPGEYGVFRLSPDGSRIVTMRDRPGGFDLWLLAVERGVSSKFSSDSSTRGYPVWSPDGRTIVFTLTPSRNLHRRDSSGAGADLRLIPSPLPQYATDWSGNGRSLLYWENAEATGRDLWILPVTPDGTPAPGTAPRPYLRTPANEWWGRFSPEPVPRWVAYQSDESGSFEIYIDAFPQPRGRKKISTAGGTYPQWGAGGRELFYVSPGSRLMVVDMKETANGLEPSVPRELFRLPAGPFGYSPYEVTPDGQRFLVLATPEHAAPQPLTVIVNWPALLKDGKG